MNLSRRQFFGAMVILPVVAAAVAKRALEGEQQPLIANREDFYREAHAAWVRSDDYAEIARRHTEALLRSAAQARREAEAKFFASDGKWYLPRDFDTSTMRYVYRDRTGIYGSAG